MHMRRRPSPDEPAAGFADSPRQDEQRPRHADHGDAGGQESTGVHAEWTQRPADVPPPEGVPPAPGTLHADPPLPEVGRQSQRPGQHGRFEDRPGARDVETLKSAEEPGFGPDTGPATRRGSAYDARDDGSNAATRRSSAAPTSGRRDHGVGAEDPPASNETPRRGRPE